MMRAKFLIAILIIFFLFLEIKSLLGESWVYDEKLHLEAGYTFLTKHDFRQEPFNPPLMREITALPLLISPAIFKDPILFWPRIMIVFLTLILGLLVFTWAKKLYGEKAGFFALFLFILEPNLLAHGHYATTDMGLTFFFFLSLFLFWLWRKKINFWRLAMFSVITGLTLSTKISALPFLLVSFLIIYFLERGKRDFLTVNFWSKRLPYLLFVIGIALLTLWATYFFTFEPLLGLRLDPQRPAITLAKENPLINFALNQYVPLGSYVSTIKQVILYNYQGKEVFLAGSFSQTGWFYFFPVAFLIKTPLPLLIFSLGAWFLFKRKVEEKYLLVPIGVIFLFAILSRLNLGIRYILPLYPFLIVFASQIINWKGRLSKIFTGTIIILVFWYFWGAARVSPHYLTFFNELVGGPRHGHRYLVDSNLDWGQGLLALKNYQKEQKIENLQLAYFGTVNPALYDFPYQRIKDISLGDNKMVVPADLRGKSVLAISATCWYFCGYYKDKDFRDLEPTDFVGNSILIFKPNSQ